MNSANSQPPEASPAAASPSERASAKNERWQPSLTSNINERGPLPRHCDLPYPDFMHLAANQDSVGIKQTTWLAGQLKFWKFIFLVGTLAFTFIVCITYIGFSILKGSLVFALPFVIHFGPVALAFFLLWRLCFLIERYWVKHPISFIMFNRKTNRLKLTYGWSRRTIDTSFNNVHGYIRYVSLPSGLSQPKLLIKIFSEHSPHKEELSYFLNLGVADTEYQIMAQWSVLCRFMDKARPYPNNPQFWDAALEHQYPGAIYNLEKHDQAPQEIKEYYSNNLCDYFLDQNAMGMHGAEDSAGYMGIFDDENPYKRTVAQLNERCADIAQQITELEATFGISFAPPHASVWESEYQ